MGTVIATLSTCPLCGHSFDPAAHLACQTCPLHAGCHLVCCPACGHTTVDPGQSRLVRWLTALLDRSTARQLTERAPVQARERGHLPLATLADVPLDYKVRVVEMEALPMAQREQLHGYGILPGCVLRVVQHTPVTVVQIEHTELALETAVAQAVRVSDVT
jgi:Fe2+ transport system protein FeoA